MMGFLPITKCGSTFLKHLFWQLHFGAPFSGARSVHAYDDQLPSGAGLREADIQNNPSYFVVLRDPVDRLVSLYLDKLQLPNDESRPVKTFRRLVRWEPDYNWAAETAKAHQRNLEIVTELLQFSLSQDDKTYKNPHWARQSDRVDRLARPLGLVALPLNGLDQKLDLILSPNMPDIADQIAKVKHRNRTGAKQRVEVGDALKLKIQQLYPQDYENWSRIMSDWERVARPQDAPRLS